MSISSHSGIILLAIVGVLTTIGVAVIAAIETWRMEKDNDEAGKKTVI